jgi:hypothetical protein
MRSGSILFCGSVLFIFVVGARLAGGEQPKELLLNGSFEDGQKEPMGWNRTARSAWKSGAAHRGHRFAQLDAADEHGWVSNTVPLSPKADYRLEGWIRTTAGEARLGVDLVGANGELVRSIESPHVEHVADWHYVAVEFTADANQAKVWLASSGPADFDDVALTPVATSYIGNHNVQPDAKGRIGFWGEEKDDSIASGKRAGTHRSDPAAKRDAMASLMVESTSEWYAVSSVNYPLPAFTDKIELSGWARANSGATAQILACWTDDMQQVVRVDPGPETRGGDWQRLHVTPSAPPDRATSIRLVALARGGRAWFDEFDLLHLRPTKPLVRVFVNQVGYELAGPKSAVVASNFFPADGTTLDVQLLAADGHEALKIQVPCAGRIHSGRPDDWGWYFWRVDFSAWQKPGEYKLCAGHKLGAGLLTPPAVAHAVARSGDRPQQREARGESFPFVINRGAILSRTAASAVDFFFVQRCGFDVPGWHKACHLDDAKLPDGTHLDVTGGWHSAGDYNKPMWQFGDSGASYALATIFEAQPKLFSRWKRTGAKIPDALDEAWWGAKYLAKMQNPADGSMRGDVLQGPERTWMKWLAPDVHTDNQIGTADDPVIASRAANVPLTIAAWAAVARQLSAAGITSDYMERADRLWTLSTAAESAANNPLLLIGSLELDRAHPGEKYRQFARRSVESILRSQKPNGAMPGDNGDHGDVAAAAVTLYALQYNDDPLRKTIVDAMQHYLEFCLARTDNPFGLSRQGTEEPEATFFHPTVGLGVNFWILSRAWAALLVHQLTHDPRALAYATDQIDWVLGKNPLNLCMFEGQGGLNPPRYHHRYNMIAGHERGAVPGTIPNGMVRDMGLVDRPGFDMSRGGNRSPSFRTSEPWLVHNMFYLLAASALDKGVGR